MPFPFLAFRLVPVHHMPQRGLAVLVQIKRSQHQLFLFVPTGSGLLSLPVVNGYQDQLWGPVPTYMTLNMVKLCPLPVPE